MNIYPLFSGVPYKSPSLRFVFPSGAKITFSHLNKETSVLGWQGGQIALLSFDELTHFSRSQFFYMLSRNRSTSGVRPYVRATTNPDADSWVADFIGWWIDAEGYPIPERAGVLRWFIRVSDEIRWGSSPKELAKEYGVSLDDPKSVTFIPAKITDNPVLLRKDPQYLSNLKALGRVERARLLDGNWKIRPAAGLIFPRSAVQIIEHAPTDIVATCRAWDLAASVATESNPSPDATAGVKMARRSNGRFVVMHVAHARKAAHDVRQMLVNTASQDGRRTKIHIPQDPAQAGKSQVSSLATLLVGYPVKFSIASGNKITRAEPFASQWQAGNVDIVKGSWNAAYLDELDNFPDGKHDDCVDASADAFSQLEKFSTIEFESTGTKRIYRR
jgi:predicted phage terminase large subunit-like protein